MRRSRRSEQQNHARCRRRADGVGLARNARYFRAGIYHNPLTSASSLILVTWLSVISLFQTPSQRMTVSSTPLPRQSRPLSRFSLFLVFFVGVCSGTLAAAEPAEGQKLLLTGDYAGAIKLAQTALDDGAPNEEWSLVLGKSLLTVGRLADAEDAVAKALSRQSTSIRLRWLGREISLASGRPEQATKIVESIFQLYSERYWAYRSPPDLVVFGRVALIKGADPKDVLDKVFAVAQKTAPTLRDVYLARGDLAGKT
jgi:tetratricopeptide (TPR) repeat protein